jgi:peptidoglycan hydrolase CwlO-like protein
MSTPTMNNLAAEQLFAVIGELEFSRRALLNELRQRDQVIAEQNAKIVQFNSAASANVKDAETLGKDAGAALATAAREAKPAPAP